MTAAVSEKPTHNAVVKLKNVEFNFEEFVVPSGLEEELRTELLGYEYSMERNQNQGDAIDEDILEEVFVEEVQEYTDFPVTSITIDWPNSYVEVYETGERLISNIK